MTHGCLLFVAQCSATTCDGVSLRYAAIDTCAGAQCCWKIYLDCSLKGWGSQKGQFLRRSFMLVSMYLVCTAFLVKIHAVPA